MRNFDISSEKSMPSDRSKIGEASEMAESEEMHSINGIGMSSELLDSTAPQVFGDLSPEALNYIQRLQSELTNVKEVSICSLSFLLFSHPQFLVHFFQLCLS